MGKQNDYVKALQKGKKTTTAYYLKSVHKKTEQQKFLEKLLGKFKSGKDLKIADIACGAGGLSFHLSKLKPFKTAGFQLVDYNKAAIDLARNTLKGKQFSFSLDSIYDMKNQKTNYFDLVFCWQTLSWLDEPEKALNELVRITKPGGKIYASSLFNLHHDVDVYSKVIDHSHPSSKQNMFFSYNTYSQFTVNKWLKGKIKKFKIHPFVLPINIKYTGRGLGTYTRKLAKKENIQISGGMLLNWAVLEITK
jgi:ubiquinone/menaquinone biosynthesis C-methylase UbiE